MRYTARCAFLKASHIFEDFSISNSLVALVEAMDGCSYCNQFGIYGWERERSIFPPDHNFTTLILHQIEGFSFPVNEVGTIEILEFWKRTLGLWKKGKRIIGKKTIFETGLSE